MDDCLNSGRFEELDNLVHEPKGRPSELWQLARQIVDLKQRAQVAYTMGDRDEALDLQMNSHRAERVFKTLVDGLGLFGDEAIPKGITVGDVHLTLQIYTGLSNEIDGRWFITDAYIVPVLDTHGRPIAAPSEANR